MASNLFDWELFILATTLIGLAYAALQSFLLLRIPVTEEKPEKFLINKTRGQCIHAEAVH